MRAEAPLELVEHRFAEAPRLLTLLQAADELGGSTLPLTLVLPRTELPDGHLPVVRQAEVAHVANVLRVKDDVPDAGVLDEARGTRVTHHQQGLLVEARTRQRLDQLDSFGR